MSNQTGENNLSLAYDSIDWGKISSGFQINRNYIWLNNCGVSPMSDFIAGGLLDFSEEYRRQCYYGSDYAYLKLQEEIKEVIGNLIGAGQDELALIHHTSEGMNFISHGLRLQPNDRVILLKDEYPSNIYPWYHLEQKGVFIDYIDPAADDELFLANLISQIRPETRLVSISGVHWITGAVFPLERAGQICKEHGIFFCVDGAQSAGLIPLDMKKMNIDAMAFSAWKWLMGPLGLGVFYINKEKLDLLNLEFMGTGSVINDEQYLPYRKELKPNADRFTYSTPSLQDWAWFSLSLQYLNRLGFSNVRKRVLELARAIRLMLKETGFAFALSDEQSISSGIISAYVPEGSPYRLRHSEEIQALLEANSVISSLRKNYVRFSPHIGNHEEQIKELKKILQKIAG